MSDINPSQKPCFQLCQSCFRCSDKGAYAKCVHCSGRHDPEGQRDPYDIDDRCRCTEGVLQYRTKSGRFIQQRFLSDPFAGKVRVDAETADERDWNAFIAEKRELLDDPYYDPIQFTTGGSVDAWLQKWKRGQ